MDSAALQTALISGVIGLFAGLAGSWFQSLRNIKEKKFEVLFEYRKELYSKLHRITFTSERFGQARYHWQIDGDRSSKKFFIEEFKEWFSKLRDFYEDSSWAIDNSVYVKLDTLYKVAIE